MGFTYGNRPGARIPAMEQRHFWFIADTIKQGVLIARERREDQPAVVDMALRFAEGCKASNPKFQRDKFLEACGLIYDLTNSRWGF